MVDFLPKKNRFGTPVPKKRSEKSRPGSGTSMGVTKRTSELRREVRAGNSHYD